MQKGNIIKKSISQYFDNSAFQYYCQKPFSRQMVYVVLAMNNCWSWKGPFYISVCALLFWPVVYGSELQTSSNPSRGFRSVMTWQSFVSPGHFSELKTAEKFSWWIFFNYFLSISRAGVSGCFLNEPSTSRRTARELCVPAPKTSLAKHCAIERYSRWLDGSKRCSRLMLSDSVAPVFIHNALLLRALWLVDSSRRPPSG